MKSSWAGAVGLTQFMPTEYLKYADDGDGDGKADIWRSVDDALASAARQLEGKGWKRGQCAGAMKCARARPIVPSKDHPTSGRSPSGWISAS